METTNKQRNITIAVVVVVILALLGGAYAFDHRLDNKDGETVATSTLDFSTSTPIAATSSTVVGSKTSKPTPAPNLNLGDGYVRLEGVVLKPKSDTAAWSTYSNSTYGFSVMYPLNAEVRKFIDGANQDYGVGLTFKETGGRFAEKYFEITTEVGATTACDALLDSNSTKLAAVGKVNFIQREYNDGTSHVVEYTSKVGSTCYHAFTRLNKPSTGAASAANGDATTKSEGQMLEDIVATFKLTK